MRKGKVNIVMDGQWGSTGKGKLAGYLALRNDIAAVSCDFMPNAGHTFLSKEHGKVVTSALPTALVNRDAMLLLNAGAAIDLDKLQSEMDRFADYRVAERLMIHPHAVVITQEDKDEEARVLGRISSTLKGCGGATSRKIMRVATVAKDVPELARFIGDTSMTMQTLLRAGATVLIEGAQGFDLSLNHGNAYPYVTSRDVTTMSILNNAGVPPHYLGEVYGCIRTRPIRVGNTYNEAGEMTGWSGPFYDDHEELTWDMVREMSGSPVDVAERTTVTQKIRRVFGFSHKQIERFVSFCAPTKIFVNFINHIDSGDFGATNVSMLSSDSLQFLSNLQDFLRVKFDGVTSVPTPSISHIGTGPDDEQMVEV